MRKANFTVAAMHGEMLQAERDSIMKSFRDATRYFLLLFILCFVLTFVISRVLITTDLWARGIDVQQVSLVINYDLPNNREVILIFSLYCVVLTCHFRITFTELVEVVVLDVRVLLSILWRMRISVFYVILSSSIPLKLMKCRMCSSSHSFHSSLFVVSHSSRSTFLCLISSLTFFYLEWTWLTWFKVRLYTRVCFLIIKCENDTGIVTKRETLFALL